MNCPKKTTYTIKRCDTLFKLAYNFKTTEEMILELNPGLDPQNLHIGQIIEICPNTANMIPATSSDNNGITSKQASLHDEFRGLWEQHIIYTRMVINAVVDPEADDEAVTARLLQNPKDFAEVYRRYFGDIVALEIDHLITEHLTIGKQLIAASAAKDVEISKTLNAEWYKNADDWATYLKKISPNINESVMRKMLRSHLDVVKEQVGLRIEKNYPANILSYDKGEQMALEMADMMSAAIMRQFPNQFI